MRIRPLLIVLTLSTACLAGAPPTTNPSTQPSTQPAKEIHIDMDKSVNVPLPEIKAELAPQAFKMPDGKEGWVVRIPGNRPIATPAYARIDGRGMLFVGGGYGSHEFYAFDAVTGQKVWQIQTGDDGPTAAVVEDGYVSFNIESMETQLSAAPITGAPTFEMELLMSVPRQTAIGKLREQIGKLCDELNIDWQLAAM
jgi:hypothetical protein